VTVSAELRALMEELARVVRADVRVVDGAAEMVAPDGRVFARATGDDTLALHTDANPGAIARRDLGDGWWEVDPWPSDVTFRRGPELLRDAVRTAAAG
jgi:hypothetical protein